LFKAKELYTEKVFGQIRAFGLESGGLSDT
jgi:hypothetical protein